MASTKRWEKVRTASEKASAPRGAARCSKLGNVLLDVAIEGVGGLLTRIAFGVRVHWMHPFGGLRLSHGHKISDALSKRSTYTSDAISESRCGLHGSDRRHVNGNLDVAAWIKSVRGNLPITDGVHGGTLTHFTCAMHFQSLSSDDRDSTAFSRCAESPSISNSETAGCRTARPNAQH